MKSLLYTLLFMLTLTSCGVGNFSQRNHIKKVRVAKLETKKNGQVVKQDGSSVVVQSKEIASTENDHDQKEIIESPLPQKSLKISKPKEIAVKVAKAKEVKKFKELAKMIREAKDEIASTESNPLGKLAATFSIITMGLFATGSMLSATGIGSWAAVFFSIPALLSYITTIVLSSMAKKQSNQYPNSNGYARFGEGVGKVFTIVGIILGAISLTVLIVILIYVLFVILMF